MAEFNTWGPINWPDYYRRPTQPDGPESLRMLGLRPWPCANCGKASGCHRRVELGSTNQCLAIRRWMYDDYPKLRQLFIGKKRAAPGGSSSEDGK